MSVTLSPRRLRHTVGATLVGSFIAGVAFFTGTGAIATPEVVCSLATPVTAVESGLHSVSFEAEGNCGGVSVALVSVAGTLETKIASDALDGDNAATFTFGSVPAGAVYEFRIAGKTATTSAPITVATFSG
jgi:hypothetical protein